MREDANGGWHDGGMATGPVPLAPGVWRIPTLGSSAINSFAMVDDDGTLTLVDAGLRGAPRRLVTALSELGKRPADVARIVLTHVHRDHAGGASKMRATTGGRSTSTTTRAVCSRAAASPRPTAALPLGRVLAYLDPGGPRCTVDATFSEGDVIPAAGGLRVLHTPGHSPGHCSFLLERHGVLITGDAIFNFRSKISWSVASFCSNFALVQGDCATIGRRGLRGGGLYPRSRDPRSGARGRPRIPPPASSGSLSPTARRDPARRRRSAETLSGDAERGSRARRSRTRRTPRWSRPWRARRPRR